MSIPGGIRVKLALALLGIVGGALLAAYVIVVPVARAPARRRRSSTSSRATRRRSRSATPALRGAEQPHGSTDFVDGAGFVSNSRVVVFAVGGSPGEPDAALAGRLVGRRRLGDREGLDGARGRRDGPDRSRARVRHDGREYAEVAVPLLAAGNVMLLSSSLSDQLATVALVKRRLLYATVVGPADRGRARASPSPRSTRAGSGGCSGRPTGSPRARSTSRSSTTSADEVGQLAASFDRMRIQLAQLDRARKEFVANASHELRTPLFSLAGFLELLADEDLDEKHAAGVPRDDAEPGRAADEASRPTCSTSPGWMRAGSGSSARRSDWPRSRASSRRTSPPSRTHRATRSLRRRRRRRLGARRRGARAADRPRARGQRARPHARRHDGALRVERRGDRVALVVEDDGPGHPGRAPRPHLPALLPRRRGPGVRERPRPRDRPRARGPDGRHRHGRERARRDDVHARAAGGGAAARGARVAVAG